MKELNIKAVLIGISVDIVGSIISVYFDDGTGFVLLGTRNDATHDGTGGTSIGIYGVTMGGALDDFGGGEL